MSLRRVFTNPRLFRAVQYRAYSTAGYGNVTTSQQNLEQPPLDVEDPHEIQSTPPPQHAQEVQQAAEKSETAPKDKKREKDALKTQKKEFNKGSQEAMKNFSSGCD